VSKQSHALKFSDEKQFHGLVLMEGEWKPPEWWYRKQRPPSDEAYFENMSRVIFQAGLNWKVIDKKWPTIKTAFAKFSPAKISCFTCSDVARLMNDTGIVSNKAKIQATIYNATEFQNIKKQYGSFQKYIDTLNKDKNYAQAIKQLTKRFEPLGPSSASLFLYTVGEKIEP
jgi:DNA-3-methyladenine glycosylase I